METEAFSWRNPDYAPIWAARAERLGRLRAEPFLAPSLKQFYADHPVEFINDWCITFDPRAVEIGLEATMPFLLFPKQSDYILWMKARWEGREDGLVEKSRDMGVSWLCCAFAVWMLLFKPGTVIGFGSRKEIFVDEIGNPSSLFWKIRELIAKLPVEFQPKGYSSKLHAPFMRIMNPENGSTIVGEAGDNVGRGARTSIYFIDESAFCERQDSIRAALSQTSNCKIHVSTPNGNGNAFYRDRIAGRVPVFSFHWRDDPRKDDAWYAKQVATLDPTIVAAEIDVDYNASVSDSWIPGDLVEAAQRRGPADVVANGPWFIGVDAAHMGDDEAVVTARRGLLTVEQIVRRQLDGPDLAGLVEQTCDDLCRAAPMGCIVIELDGPGVSAYDALKRGRYAQHVLGVHTGARQSDNRNWNLKARIWRDALDYLKTGGCSMPRCSELKMQLAAVRYKYKDGLLLMEAKPDNKKRLGRSPDRADSWVLTFAGKMQQIGGYDFSKSAAQGIRL